MQPLNQDIAYNEHVFGHMLRGPKKEGAVEAWQTFHVYVAVKCNMMYGVVS